MSVDWHDLEYDWEVAALLVDPHDCNSIVGELQGVESSGCSVTEGYYVDTRVSAQVSTVVPIGESDGYVRNARIRLVLRVPRRGWERELITGFVTDIHPSEHHGQTKRVYSLDSSLWSISEDAITSKVTCAAGSKAMTVCRKLLKDRYIEFDDNGAQDRSIPKVTVYEPATMLLNLLFDITNGYSRLDVSGHGPITFRKYVAPSKRTPSLTIDPDDPHTLVIGEVSEDDETWELPGAAIVTANLSKTTKDKAGKSVTTHETRAGVYTAPNSHVASRNNRGYLRFVKDTYSGNKEEPSVSELTNAAKQKFNASQDKGRSWTLTQLYEDLHAGDIVTLVRADGSHRCLVQTVETSLDARYRTQRLTLKEV